MTATVTHVSGLARSAALLALLGLLAGGCASVRPTPSNRDFEIAAARRNLGVDHLTNGRTAMAIRDLRHSVMLREDDASSQMWLGEAYRRTGHLKEARQAMERALELDPEDHESRLNYSVLLIALEEYAAAIEQTELLIDDPTFAYPWRALTNRGWAELKLGHHTSARRSFSRALEYHQGYWPAVLNLGILASIEGDHLAALRHLSEVNQLATPPGAQAEANYRMAEVYVSLGLQERAVERLGLAIHQEPYGRWGRQSRDYLKLLQGG